MARFNLKEYLQKTANYEGIQGYWLAQSRAWANCTRAKLNKGASAHEAWDSCLEEFQVGERDIDWISRYASELVDRIEKSSQCSGGGQLQMGGYWQRIKKKQSEGKTTGQAVMETLDELTDEGAAIPGDKKLSANADDPNVRLASEPSE